MLTIHQFEFEVEATTPLGLYRHSGTALRAALFEALSRHFCAAPTDARTPGHTAECPVCWLLAREVAGGERGKDVPRPLALRPPQLDASTDFHPGERWRFGLTLVGEATINLLPYLLLAVEAMGERGLGRPLSGRRGRFALRRVWAVNPLTEARQLVLAEGERTLANPALAITAPQIEAAAQRLAAGAAGAGGRLALHFVTPVRLIEKGALVREPRFGPLFRRLLERVERLSELYGAGAPLDPDERARLLAAGDGVALVDHRTRWIDLQSPSSRTRRATPIGGLVGPALYRSDAWPLLLPWLLWGTLVQVGKDTTKGNGWYEVRPAVE